MSCSDDESQLVSTTGLQNRAQQGCLQQVVAFWNILTSAGASSHVRFRSGGQADQNLCI